MPRKISFVVATWILLASLMPGVVRAQGADPLDQLRPGEWYEVPDSRLDAVAPSEKQFPWLRGNISGVIDCWAGGAFDTQRDRLYIGPGGGHGGYNGNEVYAFDLHDLKWHRLTDPDPVIPGFCYVPSIDKFAAWANGPDVYTLDMDSRRWTKHPPAPANRVVPGPAQQWGTFGRFRYVTSRNLFILYNGVKQNVYLYRLTADKPNPITGVEAKAVRNSVERDIPSRAISVQAVYADGTKKDVTGEADYFSLDPSVATTDLRGKGFVTGVGLGPARIRAVYTDPAYKRGYSSEVTVTVAPLAPEASLDAVHCNADRLTMVAGDTFQLHAIGAYTRGADHFTRVGGDEVTWSSGAPDAVEISNGLVRAIRPAKRVVIRATMAGKTDAIDVTVIDTPVVRRISFGVKDATIRPGWLAETGALFTDTRGYGWLDNHDLATRDDRASAHHELLMRFNAAKDKRYRVSVPPGPYSVRIAMGDADYGMTPFEGWTALGDEKLMYYEGRGNTIATRRVSAGDAGLVFTVNGPINYLIVAPFGIDLDKYADDGPEHR